jgi:hypothetical protein
LPIINIHLPKRWISGGEHMKQHYYDLIEYNKGWQEVDEGTNVLF